MLKKPRDERGGKCYASQATSILLVGASGSHKNSTLISDIPLWTRIRDLKASTLVTTSKIVSTRYTDNDNRGEDPRII